MIALIYSMSLLLVAPENQAQLNRLRIEIKCLEWQTSKKFQDEKSLFDEAKSISIASLPVNSLEWSVTTTQFGKASSAIGCRIVKQGDSVELDVSVNLTGCFCTEEPDVETIAVSSNGIPVQFKTPVIIGCWRFGDTSRCIVLSFREK